MVGISDIKEQVKIHDLRRLDDIMTKIDRIAQKIREKQLHSGSTVTYISTLSTYLSYLEVLWDNLLRPHFKSEKDRKPNRQRKNDYPSYMFATLKGFQALAKGFYGMNQFVPYLACIRFASIF